MPPRATPSTLVLRVKSHRTTVFATVPSNATIATLKNLVQNALNAHAQAEAERGLPLPVESIDDFLLSLRRTDSNKRPIFVDIPEDNASTSLLDLQVKNWDAVYIRWRGEDGVYAPVKVTLPRLEAPSDEDEPNEEEEDEEEEKEEAPAPKKNKGKGKS